MKVWFKRILVGLLVVLTVALVGIATFVLTFDPNEYKYKFEEVVYNRYQRTLSIDGDIELSLFPRIGLSVNDVSLSNRDSDDVFASVENARFAVAIWPLLFSHFVVDHVAITGLRAWVRRDSDGTFNFDDLIRADSPSSIPIVLDPAGQLLGTAQAREPSHDHTPGDMTFDESQETSLQIDIAGLDLKEAEIHYFDEVNGHVMHLVRLQLTTGRMTFDQAFDVSFKGRLLGESPVAEAEVEGQALVKIDPLQKLHSAQKLNLRLTGLLGDLDAQSASLRGNFAYSGYLNSFDASAIEVAVQGDRAGLNPVENLEASLVLPRLKIDRSRAEFNLEKLALRARGDLPGHVFDMAFDAPSLSISPEAAKGEAVSGTLKFTGETVLGVALSASGVGGNAHNLTLKELKLASSYKNGEHLMQVNISSPAQWDVFNESGKLSAVKGDVSIEDPALPSDRFEFPLIGSVHADLNEEKITGDINAVLNGAPLNFKLTSMGLEMPKVTFSLQADALDFNRIFPVAAPAEGDQPEEEQAPPADVPNDVPERAADDAAAGDDSDATAAQRLTLLEGIDVTGTIHIGSLKVRELEAENVEASVRALNGKLEVSGIDAELYDGTLAGQLTVDSSSRYAASAEMTGVSTGPLTAALTGHERISGTGAIKVDLTSAGTNVSEFKSALDGSVRGQLRDGAVQGIDLNQTITQVSDILETVLDGQGPSWTRVSDLSKETAFSSFDVAVTFDKGVGTVDQLALDAPAFKVRHAKPAIIDLASDNIDLMAHIQIVGAPDKTGVALSRLKGITVPVHISGELAAPEYDVQWKAMRGRLVQNAIERGLFELLDSSRGSEAEKPGILPGDTGAGRAPADKVKDLGKALKGLLGK